MTKIDILYDESTKIELTVALPVYNSKKIAWVCLEGLCNQIDIDFEWELIIYEEYHDESCFPNILFDYVNRLKEVNCKKIIFLTNNDKTPLITKWLEIANNSSDSSIVYLLQPADCYSHKKRLRVTYDKIVKEGYDWYDQKTGNFYSLLSDRIITYDYNGITNLCIATLTKVMRTLPNSTQTSGIDGYTYKYVSSEIGSKFKRFLDQNIYDDGLDIHGLNNISKQRETFFSTKPNIFKILNLTIDDLNIPSDIIEKLKSLRIKPKPIQTENILQPKIRVSKRKNEVVSPVSSNLTQFNLSKNNTNTFLLLKNNNNNNNNNKGPQSVGVIIR